MKKPVGVNRDFVRRQLAFRQLLLDGNGNPTRNGRIAIATLRRLLGAGPGQHITKLVPGGAIDPVATVAAAQRREAWDALVRLVNLDAYTVTNIEED
ncbi:MAG: hypothetical protein IOC96_13750 [Rhodobacter sp.]|nr:hypothetical protein [Cupriavidus sp.]MCA3514262.1 hypothetical protein [Rhodobacter sp.]